MRYFTLLLSILLLVSCKLFETKDTTAPVVNLAIEGGNEISREVTLYLDIEDDSKIDYVDIIIDDTTAVTVTSNFDTIRFDVTPFADESDHQLFAKVADSEGNIGESEKIDVVITEYPGWRIYGHDNYSDSWVFTIDENGLIWSGIIEINIFNPASETSRILNYENSPLIYDYIENIKVIEGSRVWIINENHILEYHYDLDKWLNDIVLPETDRWYSGLAIDNDYNVWIGSNWGNINQVLFKYDHISLTSFQGSIVGDISDIEFYKDGSILLSGEPGVDIFKNGAIYSFDDYPYPQDDGIQVVIDSLGYVWSNGVDYGAYRFDGQSWESKLLPAELASDRHRVNPIFTSKSGILYCTVIDYANQFIDIGVFTFDGENWLRWSDFDNPFTEELSIDSRKFISNNAIAEAPNGDIWMITYKNGLMRYRPSLGGYP